MHLFHFSTCFEQPRAHNQENQLYQYNIWCMSLCVGDGLVWAVRSNLRQAVATQKHRCSNFLAVNLFPHGCRPIIGWHGWREVWGVVCMRFRFGFLTQSYSLVIWILYTSFRFGLASPGRPAAPHRLSGAVQASGYDSNQIFFFVVLFVNSGFNGVSVHTRRLGSTLLFSRRVTDSRCGGAVSRNLV
jgi:hypothetical protein